MKYSDIQGYVYFGVGVLLVTAVTGLKMTCPIDGGSGRITGAGGLKVTDVEYTLDKFQTFDTGCAEIYSEFTYTVNVTLENTSSAASAGALLVKFYDPDAVKGTMDLADALAQKAFEQEVAENTVFITEEVSKGGQIATFLASPVASNFVFVEVPAGTTKNVQEVINFRGFGFSEVSKFGSSGVTHAVSVAPPTEAIVCPYSHGTGKVSLTEWIRLKVGLQ
jgi:hypothetical protein